MAAAIPSSSVHDSNGCCSLRLRTGLSTPTFAGLTSIIPPRNGRVKDLSERLGCFEAIAGRGRHPPRRDLLRRQLTDRAIAEDGSCFAEQIAELLDCHVLDTLGVATARPVAIRPQALASRPAAA